ncbi:hypothetical protein BJY04DRAFT_121749 [Aspergillus karnatakaensis]|uniref:uncharacterized protein n=1 Tax=Aspergillus karnatakaensis TaxID=1810916 RepID=UPI003CCCE307
MSVSIFQRTRPRAVPRRFSISLNHSLPYSSISRANRAPAAAAAVSSQPSVEPIPTSTPLFPQTQTRPTSQWNARGDEPITAETVKALVTNNLSNLGVKNFLSPEECARMVKIIRTHTIDSYGANVYPPIGKVGVTQFDNQNDKETYFASVPSALTLQNRFKTEANIDIIARVASYLSSVTNTPVRLARETIPSADGSGTEQKSYFAGLLRLINSSALIHADYGPFDAPGWEIGSITAQLSWNILLREVEGGECVIYRRFWQGKSDDERFRQPAPGYGYRRESVDGVECQVVKPERGELTLFNSRNFHEVRAVDVARGERYTVSSFIGVLPVKREDGGDGVEIILWS